MDQTITRVDPVGCSCGNCEEGTAVPIDKADQATLQRVFEGRVHNASGLIVTADTTYGYNEDERPLNSGDLSDPRAFGHSTLNTKPRPGTESNDLSAATSSDEETADEPDTEGEQPNESTPVFSNVFEQNANPGFGSGGSAQ